MGVSDRAYMRGDSGRTGGAAGPSPVQIIWWIIGINVTVFLLPALLGWGYVETPAGGYRLGGFSSSSLLQGELWTLFTYQFVHKNILHIALNMLALYFLGRHVAQALGIAQLVTLYLVGGVAGALFETVFKAVFGESTAMVGASASVSAIVAMFVALMPQAQLQIIPFPFLIRARVLLWTFLAINGVLGLLLIKASGPQTAYLAHVGGALYGLLHARYFRQPGDLLGKSKRKRSKRTRRRVKYQTRTDNEKIIDAEFAKEGTDYNAVLDKINREGIGSLTAEERRILEQASEKLSRNKR